MNVPKYIKELWRKAGHAYVDLTNCGDVHVGGLGEQYCTLGWSHIDIYKDGSFEGYTIACDDYDGSLEFTPEMTTALFETIKWLQKKKKGVFVWEF